MLLSWFRNRRRRRLLEEPFPQAWEQYLEQNFGHWKYLSEEEKSTLRDLVRIFVREKYWEGCGGLRLTDEIRVTIAAQACLLILHHGIDTYRRLRTILVYPSGYMSPMSNRVGRGVVLESSAPVLGQAHFGGPIILSWHHAREGGRQPYSGRNLVYHEFAHKLDSLNGIMNGTPLLKDRDLYDRWVSVMTREYEELVNSSDTRQFWGFTPVRQPRTLLRPYGATNPSEFFAVATEVFFEQPQELREAHPKLYDVLRDFYQQDPAARMERR